MEIQAAIDRYFGKGSTMTAEGSEDGSSLEIRLIGSLDLENSRSLQDLLTWIIGDQVSHADLIVDLGRVDYISSTGVGALTIALTEARKRDTSFRIRNLQPKVRSIFTLLGLMSYFEEAENHG